MKAGVPFFKLRIRVVSSPSDFTVKRTYGPFGAFENE